MKCLIGESGGTKTDWVLASDGVPLRSFSSESYHPSNWNDAFRARLFEFWSDKEWIRDIPVYLFVAGCYNPDRAHELHEMFSKFAPHVEVYSDLHAAGLAHFGTSAHGLIGIMGTGSVVFEFDRGSVAEVRGGKGHVMGDEGSAYYFGKLLLTNFDSGTLNADQTRSLKVLFQRTGKPSPSDKYATANLAKLTADEGIELQEIHDQNITAFAVAHNLKNGDVIYLTGSYAWFRKDQIEKKLLTFGIQVAGIIARPIDRLVELNGAFTV